MLIAVHEPPRRAYSFAPAVSTTNGTAPPILAEGTPVGVPDVDGTHRNGVVAEVASAATPIPVSPEAVTAPMVSGSAAVKPVPPANRLVRSWASEVLRVFVSESSTGATAAPVRLPDVTAVSAVIVVVAMRYLLKKKENIPVTTLVAAGSCRIVFVDITTALC